MWKRSTKIKVFPKCIFFPCWILFGQAAFLWQHNRIFSNENILSFDLHKLTKEKEPKLKITKMHQQKSNYITIISNHWNDLESYDL